MPGSEPVVLTSLLWGIAVFIGQAVTSGIIGNQSHELAKKNWKEFRENLTRCRPSESHVLLRVIYHSYLQAMLQVCARRGHALQMPVDKWPLLERNITKPIKLLTNQPNLGFRSEAESQWINKVKSDLIARLKQFHQTDNPLGDDNPELVELFQQSELLMQIPDGKQREDNIRAALEQRASDEIEKTYGPVPDGFKELFKQSWFDCLCADFQYQIKNNQEVANIFQSKLLARLVTQDKTGTAPDISLFLMQDQLSKLSGEMEGVLEQTSQLLKDQRAQLNQADQSILLSLLSSEQDTNSRIRTLQELIQAGFNQTGDRLGRIEDKVDQLQQQTQPSLGKRELIIHSLPIGEVEGREEECKIILQEMRYRQGARILAFTAPGGFGKTALLTKLIKEKITDTWRIVEPTVQAILHIDCRRGIKLLDIFTKAGRLTGRGQSFQGLYADTQQSLQEKLDTFFNWLTVDIERTVWIVLDNFETVLGEDGTFIDGELKQFFETSLTVEKGVRFLIASRMLPKVSPRLQPQIVVLEVVSKLLFEGLPPEDCINYLRKNGGPRGLSGSEDQINETLLLFAKRIHHIPMALVWAVGYMNDRQGMTLLDLLREDFFSDFDEYQYTNSPNYLDKGLKRLHYEQLTIQPPQSLVLLHLLAFFNRPTPRAALEYLLPPPKLLEALTRLSANKLVGFRAAEDKRTQSIGDGSMTPLYTLHPIICENIFFKQLSENISLEESAINEMTAATCDHSATIACGQSHFEHAVRLYELAEQVCHHLIAKNHSHELLFNLARILGNKGAALSNLNRYSEALDALDESIANYQIVKESDQSDEVANHLAAALMNKGEALRILGHSDPALECHDAAINIRRQLVRSGRVNFESDLAWALINKGVLLYDLLDFSDAINLYDEAISLLRKLIKRGLKQYKELLAVALVNKGASYQGAGELGEAAESLDEAIAIFKYLEMSKGVKEEKFFSLALRNKASVLKESNQANEALQLFDKAIAVLEQALNNGRAEYADDLATVYVIKAKLLKEVDSLEEIITLCDKAIKLWFDEVAGKQMIRCLASILEASRLRLLAKTRLNRWKEVGPDIALFLLFSAQAEEIELTEPSLQELDKTYLTLRELSKVQKDRLYENIDDYTAEVLEHFLEDEN